MKLIGEMKFKNIGVWYKGVCLFYISLFASSNLFTIVEMIQINKKLHYIVAILFFLSISYYLVQTIKKELK